MAKKRANGEGNIRKRKDGRWEGRYTAGYDEKTGKRVTKSVLGKTQAEVKEKLVAVAAERGVKNSVILWPLRVAVSGKASTPGGATELCALLGKEESLSRIEKGIALLRK